MREGGTYIVYWWTVWWFRGSEWGHWLVRVTTDGIGWVPMDVAVREGVHTLCVCSVAFEWQRMGTFDGIGWLQTNWVGMDGCASEGRGYVRCMLETGGYGWD